MHAVEVAPTAFEGGPPALWISTARRGRASLEAVVHPVSGASVAHLSPADIPDTFAALRFAPLLLVSAADLATLAADRRVALRGAIIAGATLVVSAGETEVEASVLDGLAPIRLGPLAPPGRHLRAGVPRLALRAPSVGARGAPGPPCPFPR